MQFLLKEETKIFDSCLKVDKQQKGGSFTIEVVMRINFELIDF